MVYGKLELTFVGAQDKVLEWPELKQAMGYMGIWSQLEGNLI